MKIERNWYYKHFQDGQLIKEQKQNKVLEKTIDDITKNTQNHKKHEDRADNAILQRGKKYLIRRRKNSFLKTTYEHCKESENDISMKTCRDSTLNTCSVNALFRPVCLMWNCILNDL